MRNRILSICGVLLLAVCLLFSACGSGPKYEKISTTAPLAGETQAQTTEATTAAQSDSNNTFAFAAGIKMGMTISEVQKLIGQETAITEVDGRKSFANDFTGIFLNYSTTKTVNFMFDPATEKLEQLQFRGNSDSDGVMTADAITLFDARYGKHGSLQGNYMNHIWFADGVYIVLSVVDDHNFAVTYTEKNYFEETYPEELAAYKNAQ